jgi:hypothetical protein
MAIAFTLGFIINSIVIAMAKGAQPPTWVYFFALVPLFLLFPTGLYMFFQPYVGKRRGKRASA